MYFPRDNAVTKLYKCICTHNLHRKKAWNLQSAQVASKPLRNFDHHIYKANIPLVGLQSVNFNFEHPLPRRSIQFPRSGQAFCYTQPSLNAIWVSWAKYVPSELFRLQKDLE